MFESFRFKLTVLKHFLGDDFVCVEAVFGEDERVRPGAELLSTGVFRQPPVEDLEVEERAFRLFHVSFDVLKRYNKTVMLVLQDSATTQPPFSNRVS